MAPFLVCLVSLAATTLVAQTPEDPSADERPQDSQQCVNISQKLQDLGTEDFGKSLELERTRTAIGEFDSLPDEERALEQNVTRRENLAAHLEKLIREIVIIRATIEAMQEQMSRECEPSND